MSTRNDLLETCLARLAAGDSVERCLADYPEDAEWLRPFLTAADHLHTLPSQQPRPAADRAIQQQLRRAVRQLPAANQKANHFRFHFMEDSMKNISRFLVKWLPRTAVAGTAVALLIIFITQFSAPLPFLSGPEIEPAVEPLSTNVTTVGDTTITLEADLANPGEVPLYRAQLEPVPATPDEALAWAQNFGLSDPEVYRSADDNDPALYVLGSDGHRLTFQNYGGFNEIVYTDPAAAVNSGEPISFDEASAIAANFLRNHNALPDDYLAEPALGGGGPVQQVIIRPKVEGGVIGGDTPGATMRVGVSTNGQVIHASISHLALEPAGTTTVISAQDAYDDLLNGRNVMGSTYSTTTAGGEGYRSYQPPLPTREVGQTIDLIGHVNTFINAQTGERHMTLIPFMLPGQGNYVLTGRIVDELSLVQTQQNNIRIQGTITAQDGLNGWQVAVENWETTPPLIGSCLTGTLMRTENTAQFRSEDGVNYDLPDAPEDIENGEQIEVCLSTPVEPGDTLAWIAINVPPSNGGVSSGGGGGGMVTEQVVVEQVEEVAVTRVVAEEVSEQGGSGIVELAPQPVPTAVFVEPSNPYEIGDEIEATGIVQLFRIVDEDGEERLEATFADDGNQGDASYPFTYPLLAEPELLEEMAEFSSLHIRVYGRIVPAPETESFIIPNQEQAIEVDRFDRPWPDEKMEQFLGHFSLEELEGQQVLIFSDHATNQQYVVDLPGMTPDMYEHDPAMQEDQVLLTGIIHPVETFGGLPRLERRGTRTGSDVAQATDVSQFPLEIGEIPMIDEAAMHRQDGLGGVVRGDVVIERVELVYPYEPQSPAFGGDTNPEPQMLEPVWAFYGRSADGREQFIIRVRAVADK